MAKILVVDDEPDMIWAITNVLLSENHSVVSVNSGEEALAKVKSIPLDLILLDFRLPGMDGIQILEKVKEIRPELPVIMVTGYGGIEEAVQAIKLGASHYISKPFDNAQLIETVNKTIQLGNLRTEGLFGKRLTEKIGPGTTAPSEKSSPLRPSKKSSSKRGVRAAAVTLAVLALLAGAGVFWKLKNPSSRTFAISHSKVSGLAFGEDDLWVTDWFTQTIERYKIKGGELELSRSVTLPGYHLTAIAYTGGALYTCDSWKKMIFKHNLDDRFSVAQSFPSPGPEPSALFYDGKYLWSSDGKNRKIYQHALDGALTVLQSYDTQAVFPIGLYSDGTTFWTASAAGGKIYRNLLQERFSLEKTFVLKPMEPGKPLSAFAMRDGKIWAAYEGANKIFELDPGKLEETNP